MNCASRVVIWVYWTWLPAQSTTRKDQFSYRLRPAEAAHHVNLSARFFVGRGNAGCNDLGQRRATPKF